MSYKLFWGRNKKGEAVRSKDGKRWHLMEGANPAKVKVCALATWKYDGKYKGKTIKEIAADDAEYLQWILEMLDPKSPQMDCLRLLLK